MQTNRQLSVSLRSSSKVLNEVDPICKTLAFFFIFITPQILEKTIVRQLEKKQKTSYKSGNLSSDFDRLAPEAPVRSLGLLCLLRTIPK